MLAIPLAIDYTIGVRQWCLKEIKTMNTLTNSYHNTEARTKLTDDELEALSYRLYDGTATDADRATRRRLHDRLCGSNDCTCGDDFGRRN